MLNLNEKEKLIQAEWAAKGAEYAHEVNRMVDYGETHGWENWHGAEPADQRTHLAQDVLSLLRKANLEDETESFRELFPPAYEPFRPFLEEQGQSIDNICFIGNDTIALVLGTASYGKKEAYMITGNKAGKLSETITYIGKSIRNEIFAIAEGSTVTTYKGWGGPEICTFMLPPAQSPETGLPITSLVPFNDGLTLLLVSGEGIYLLKSSGNKLIHPLPDPEDEEWPIDLAMGHAALSPDNNLIALGDQHSEHRILDSMGTEITEVSPLSSYCHYAVFSKDGRQVVLNACQYYDGISIGVDTADLGKIEIDVDTENDTYTIVDEECRVFSAVALSQYYIFGDAYGYIRASAKDGRRIWRYFLGSSITAMAVSDDEKTLWVATFSGIVHKLRLDAGQRDNHTIGTGQHYEEFRMMFWKSEPAPLIW